MKKSFTSLRSTAVTAVVIASLGWSIAACGGSSSPGKASADEKVTITYAMWAELSKPAEEKVIAAFEKVNPNITVKIQLTPWDQYWAKLQAATTGGTLADVVWMNPNHLALYASNKVLAPISDRIKADHIDMSLYSQPVVESTQWQGKQYAMPRDDSLIALWYNKKLFDAAGVKYPTDTWTWDDATDAANKLTDKKKGQYGIAAGPWNQSNYYPTIFQAGGKVLSADGKSSAIDSPEAAAGLQYWVDFISSGAAPSIQHMTDTDPTIEFFNGKIAMCYLGNWMAGAIAESDAAKDVDVQVLPMGKVRATTELGLSYGIYAKSKQLDASWKFLNFMSGAEASNIRAGLGVPTAYKAALPTWVKSFPQYNLQAYVDEAAYGVTFPVSENTDVWANKEAELIPTVWSGDLSAQAAVKQLSQSMNAALKLEQDN
jgi:multiple sugar transport system substrate-binding protein